VFQRNAAITIPGMGEVIAPILADGSKGSHVIALSVPLTLDEPLDPQIRDVQGFSPVPVVLVDELIVRTNLPSVSSDLLARLSNGLRRAIGCRLHGN
jgi:hypothetical protein